MNFIFFFLLVTAQVSSAETILCEELLLSEAATHLLGGIPVSEDGLNFMELFGMVAENFRSGERQDVMDHHRERYEMNVSYFVGYGDEPSGLSLRIYSPSEPGKMVSFALAPALENFQLIRSHETVGDIEEYKFLLVHDKATRRQTRYQEITFFFEKDSGEFLMVKIANGNSLFKRTFFGWKALQASYYYF